MLAAVGWDLEVATADDFLPPALHVLDGAFDRRSGQRRIRDLITVTTCSHALLREFSPGLLLAAAAALVVLSFAPRLLRRRLNKFRAGHKKEKRI